MGKKRKRKAKSRKNKSMVISGRDLLLNSANKENKSMAHVRTGTGVHGDTKYSRKQKHRENYKDY